MAKKESTLYYFYSVGCTFCTKVEPIVDELNSNGYDIIKLDISENKFLKEEIEQKYKLRCGTPLLVDSETGNAICGYRGDEVIKQWADGKEIPDPPKPKSSPPPLPKDWSNEKQTSKFKKSYNKWKKENKHIPGLQTADEIITKFKKSRKYQDERKNSLEGRLQTLEVKMDRLMNHLGVK